MPVFLKSPGSFVLSSTEVGQLWAIVMNKRGHADEQVNVQIVSEDTIRELNAQYREKDASTNVLSFSYGVEHDIALCLPVAEREAAERSVQVRDYVALLLVHAMLHVTGLDHERSEDEAEEMRNLEQQIMRFAGFHPISL